MRIRFQVFLIIFLAAFTPLAT
ncbi:hypothetical protein HYPGJ_31348 [Hyphomicrobium sp. GJ21]|nr:hypothetical protein HYPGJ_31348 [Hyphomicrobium sp. GJ21]